MKPKLILIEKKIKKNRTPNFKSLDDSSLYRGCLDVSHFTMEFKDCSPICNLSHLVWNRSKSKASIAFHRGPSDLTSLIFFPPHHVTSSPLWLFWDGSPLPLPDTRVSLDFVHSSLMLTTTYTENSCGWWKPLNTERVTVQAIALMGKFWWSSNHRVDMLCYP